MNQDINSLLIRWKDGDKEALNDLMPIVYNELHKLASRCLFSERNNHTLQATALVNEAYLKLVKLDSCDWKNRAQFLAISAQIMRNILVDHARKNMADKRADPKNRVSLEVIVDQAQTENLDLVALDDALRKFATIDPQQSKIVELRFLGGLTIEETAEVLDLSPKIVRREWDTAKLWLLRELKKS